MNPFTDPIYNIYESSLWKSCADNNNLKSRIVSKNAPPPSGVYNNILKSNNLFFIERYISDELSKFIENLYWAKICDKYGTTMNTKPDIVFPEKCNSTFKNFSNDDISTSRNNIKNKQNSKLYDSQINFGEAIFDKYSYTDSYKTSKSNDNDKKELCQRLADMVQMIDDLKKILDTINTPDNIEKYKDDYDLIMKNYNKNLVMRTQLDAKIQELYYDEANRYNNSKLYLDSTVYTSVLWTILATTIIFYIFKKI